MFDYLIWDYWKVDEIWYCIYLDENDILKFSETSILGDSNGSNDLGF